jgi:hypothetical protein
MAQCSQTAFEFIQGAYGPMIAVLCTEDAEIVCQKSNLNFVELIRPFSQLTSEGNRGDCSASLCCVLEMMSVIFFI